jgi:hypothetical protein
MWMLLIGQMQSKIFLRLLDILGRSSIALAIDHGNIWKSEIKLNDMMILLS